MVTFEMRLIKQLNFGALLRMLIKPGLFNQKKNEIFKVKKAEINSKHTMHFQVDGEYKGKIKKVAASIVPAALQVLIPKQEMKTT